MTRILLIEDDPGVREGLELALSHQGYRVDSAASGESGLERVKVSRPDVVILDLMLPGIDGFEVCRRLRLLGDVPVIMLTARGGDFDIVAGLATGADDYVVKPVEAPVLDARIRAVLRRTRREPELPQVFGDLVIDRAALSVHKAGCVINLTATELRLLLLLSESPGQVFSRHQIFASVWGKDFLGNSRLVDACIHQLRAKIEDAPAEPVYMQTVRGFGYRFGPV